MKAMILAAGQGARLRPLTEHTPKPMLRIAGKPVLQHVVEHLARFGIREVVINLHHRPEQITSHFGVGSKFGLKIVYSYEEHLLGTAGAVKKVQALFTEPFLVVYGDNLTTCDLETLYEFHRRYRAMATVALIHRRDVSQSGVAELNSYNRIVRFIEKPLPGQTASHWVSAGILVLEPEVLGMIPEDQPSDFGRDILPQLLAMGRPVYGYCMNGDETLWWVDKVEDYRRVEEEWRRADDGKWKGENGKWKEENGRRRTEG